MTSWKISLPCTRAEGEALGGGDVPALAALDPQPVVMTSEPDENRPDDWRLDAYFEAEPDEALIALLLSLAPSASRGDVTVEALPDADWVTMSQAGLNPISAGRFHVFTAAHPGTPRDGQTLLRIEAGQAFGTGHHATTAGCLSVLDELASTGRTFKNALDLGTGTGLLALAIAKTWPQARVIASDIDPVSIDVSAENIALNGTAVGEDVGEIALAVADGLAHPALAGRAPYDLIAANILAGPLIEMATGIASALTPGGTLILAGLLAGQADAVAAAYAQQNCRLVGCRDGGDWPVLTLTR